MLASRSVYDRMLSRYKKNGQFTYFDIRDTEEDPEIVEGAYDTMWKWVLVSTVKDNKNSTNRQICVNIYYINYVTK